MTTYELTDAELEASVSRLVSRVRTAEDWELGRHRTRLEVMVYLAEQDRIDEDLCKRAVEHAPRGD